MGAKLPSSNRCAIYTRKSTDHGLELEFNSLDAQREACEAYIKSQTHEGWRALQQRYDDPAYSGGNLDRPALQKLLKDIDAGRVDTVVVYKIDRLTRSLADFAKLVEVFDEKGISFVAVTQQFSTTTSMGRLTLNVLLSFAQFERELSSERVRDKVAASRKKGKWTGGSVPLGYDSKDKKLVINEREANTVRYIFRRYLETRCLRRLIAGMDEQHITTKFRPVKTGKAGGIRFTYGPLAYLLKNRVYIGETVHKDKCFQGEHEAIIDGETFEAVQDLLKANSVVRQRQRSTSRALLAGFLFDDRGNRMSPSFSSKRGTRYRFYVSSALLNGRKNEAGSLPRISAPDLEATILASLRKRCELDQQNLADQDLVNNNVDRIVVSSDKIQIAIKATLDATGENTGNASIEIIRIPTTNSPPARIETNGLEPSSEPNPALVQAIVRAHGWIKSLSDGAYKSIDELASATKLHPKIIRKGLRLAFLAPDITEAILFGQQPKPLNLSTLQQTLPLCWAEQRRVLGFTQLA